MLIDLNEIDYEIDYGDDLQVEFVSYTGRYPKLCRGDLTLLINGKKSISQRFVFTRGGVFTRRLAALDSHKGSVASSFAI